MNVRDMWQDESRDFTPWLAHNLHLLGSELGMNLELVQQEKLVGTLYLDILARESEGGALVAIENQLELTDIDHLGRLLIYAAGCDAGVAIWVAPEFVYEHAEVLHRLNEWTGSNARFYGVKVEVTRRTDGAPMEPRFRKVVHPGTWNRGVTLPPDLTDSQRYRYFFEPLVARLHGADRSFTDEPRQRFDYRDRLFPSPVDPGAGYAVSFWKNYAWVSIHIETKHKNLTKQLFDVFQAERQQIESLVGAVPDSEWVWDRHNPYSFSTVNIRKNGSIDDSPEQLEATREWMLNLLLKLKEVFEPRLAMLLPGGPTFRSGCPK